MTHGLWGLLVNETMKEEPYVSQSRKPKEETGGTPVIVPTRGDDDVIYKRADLLRVSTIAPSLLTLRKEEEIISGMFVFRLRLYNRQVFGVYRFINDSYTNRKGVRRVGHRYLTVFVFAVGPSGHPSLRVEVPLVHRGRTERLP